MAKDYDKSYIHKKSLQIMTYAFPLWIWGIQLFHNPRLVQDNPEIVWFFIVSGMFLLQFKIHAPWTPFVLLLPRDKWRMPTCPRFFLYRQHQYRLTHGGQNGLLDGWMDDRPNSVSRNLHLAFSLAAFENLQTTARC